MFENTTPVSVFIDLAIIFIIYVILRPVFVFNEDVTKKRLYAGIFFILLFCVFAFWSWDYFSYGKLFTKVRNSGKSVQDIEPVYNFLMIYICPSYEIFRLIVWGVALTLYAATIKRLNINECNAWFILGIGFLPWFSYARVSIVPAIIIYGMSLFSAPFEKNKMLSMVLGFIIILSSVFFHKSAFFGTAIALICLVVPSSTKNSWFYVILGLIIAPFILRFLFQEFITIDFGKDADISRFTTAAQSTANTSFYANSSIGPLLKDLLEHLPYFLTCILAYRIQTNYEVPRGISTILKFNFYMVLFSTLFLFDLGADTSELYERYLRFSILPGAITLTYAYEKNLFHKHTIATISCAVFATFYLLIYCVYDAFANS